MKTKMMMVMLVIVSMFLISCSTSKNPKETFKVTTTYTQISGSYGYLRVDSIAERRFSVVNDDHVTVQTNVFKTREKYSVNHSTTFLLLKLSQEEKSCVLQNQANAHVLGITDTIYRQSIVYETKWNSTYNYQLFGSGEGAYKVANDLVKNPYSKTLDGFICFRPYEKTALIVRNGGTDVYKVLENTDGMFQEVKEPYPYYFYTGKESLLLLDKQSLACVDTIPGAAVESPCDDNSRFLFLSRNNRSGWYIYDITTLKIVADKRDNNRSNIWLENETTTVYTGFTNEDEFEGSNLLKVTFDNNGKSVASLLNESTMTHTSEVLYNDIRDFNQKYLIGFLEPQTVHNVVLTNSHGKLSGSLSTTTRSYGRFGYLSSSDTDVELKNSGNQTSREKDNFQFGFLISKKTGKEIGTMYQVFDDGQKIKIQ